MCNTPTSDEMAASHAFCCTYGVVAVNKLGCSKSKCKKECATMECQSLGKSINGRRKYMRMGQIIIRRKAMGERT